MIKNLSENQCKENSLFDENLLENGLIGGLAKELAEDINLEEHWISVALCHAMAFVAEEEMKIV